MADADLSAIRRGFADLTGLFEDAASIASAGQCVNTVDQGRRQCKRMAAKVARVQRRLVRLEGRLQ